MNRVKMTEDTIGELEDITIEFILSKQERKQTEKIWT